MSQNSHPEHNPERPQNPSEVPAGYDQPSQPNYGAPVAPSYQGPATPTSGEPTYGTPNYPAPPAPTYMQPGYQQSYQQPTYGLAPGVEQKSKVVAGILGILLGYLGIHNFYLGKTKIALIQLLVSVVSFGILAPFMAIWGLIEGILILVGHENYRTDANGIPLKD